TIAGGTPTQLAVNDTIFIAAGPAADNGAYTITAVTPTTVTFTKTGAVAATGVKWMVPKLCPGLEVCINNTTDRIDNDCNGIVDDCIPGQPNSCCKVACPACAKPPYIETCNNCDDDCDGTIDNNLTDVGLACGSNVGDCAPGQTVCCSTDVTTTA